MGMRIYAGLFVYFDCVQLAIGGRGHVTQHIRGSTVHNQKRQQQQIQSGLNHGVILTMVFLIAHQAKRRAGH